MDAKPNKLRCKYEIPTSSDGLSTSDLCKFIMMANEKFGSTIRV